MKTIFIIIILLAILSTGCKSTKLSNHTNTSKVDKKNKLEQTLKFWYQEDYNGSKILGISLNKFYNLNKSKKKAIDIVVAVIDTKIDLSHEDLKEQIWINTKEIPDNGIDEDSNGYMDDINGWSFTGTKNGGYVIWSNFEYVRVIREWSPVFEDKTESQIQPENIENYNEYHRALKLYEAKNKFYKNWRKSLTFNIEVYNKVKDTLKYFFPKENYNLSHLDSLYKIYKVNDKTFRQRRDNNDQDLGALIFYMIVNHEVKHFKLEDIKDQKAQLDSVIEKNLNVDFDERNLIGDNPNKLEIGYGNNKIGASISGIQLINEHSTKVSSIIAANRKNEIGVNGFSDNIFIMPLHVSASGDEHDKDIATAIHYAVDNGARVINMSFGKEFSLHKEWIKEAFKYAENNNVLLVHAVGNDGMNIDNSPFYPNDYNYDDKEEVSNNFINVSSTNSKFGENMVSSFSNYGKKNVDLFAPGEQIYTAIPDNKYDFDSGTSLAAPMVSGTAALIWLHYPKLTVSQVKQIILESGSSYDIDVILPGTKDKKVKFSELSKSGKVLNVYNAMKMAEGISRRKK